MFPSRVREGLLVFYLLGTVFAVNPFDSNSFSNYVERQVIHLNAKKIEIPSSPTNNADLSQSSLHIQSTFHPQTNENTQWIVHVKAPITAESRQRLNAALSPYQLGSYLPHNTFMVIGPAAEHDGGEFYSRLRRAPSVLHVQEYEPSFKTSPSIWSDVSAHATHHTRELSRASSATLASLHAFTPFTQHATTTTTTTTDASSYNTIPTQLPNLFTRDGQRLYRDENGMAYLRVVISPEYLQQPSSSSWFSTTSSTSSTSSTPPLYGLAEKWSRVLTSATASSISSSLRERLQTASVAESVVIKPLDLYYEDLKMEIDASSGNGYDSMDVIVRSEDALKAVHWLANRREVHWIERVPMYYSQNRFARDVIQSDSPNHTVWDHGLHGEGEIIGIGDTGIDHTLCFFYDPNNPQLSFGSDPPNFDHRKIVRYVAIGDQSDDAGGHGTHVAGSLAGEVLTSDPAAYNALSPFNGMASKAKLAFYDFKINGRLDLMVPPDIEPKFFEDAYSVSNARIFSNSWGSPDGSYTSFARDVDNFFQRFPDTIGVFAAGNYGTDGYYSISSPGIAKNVLTAGASLSSSESFASSGESGGIKINSPTTIAGVYQAMRADFGPKYSSVSITSDIVVTSPMTGCGIILNKAAVSGKAAIVKRGDCFFFEKVRNLQAAGATFVIVANDDKPMTVMGANSGDPVGTIYIASALIEKDIGNAIISSRATVNFHSPVEFYSPTLNEFIMADFSSRGPTLDGRLKPDVVAPGQSVTSAKSDGNVNTLNCAPSDLLSMQGTSMATPITAGALAMLRQYLREGWYPTGQANADHAIPSPTGALMKAMIIHSSVAARGEVSDSGKNSRSPTISIVNVLPPPSVFQGFGRIQLDHVLKFNDPVSAQVVPNLWFANAALTNTGDATTFCFTIKPTKYQPIPFFKATLAWMDFAPDLTTSFLLINNLDLMVVNTDTGEAWTGNRQRLSESPTDVTLDALDDINNVEQISLDDSNQRFSQFSTWGVNLTIVVRGTYLPGGQQPFAVVATGTFDGDNTSPRSCQVQVPCPGGCGVNGECRSNGQCVCNGDWYGADCAIPSSPLLLDPSRSSHWTGMGHVASGEWMYHDFDITDNDLAEGLSVILTRLSSLGDPDLYVSFNAYPDLRHAEFASTECEPCGTKDSPVVSTVVLKREDLQVGRYRVGVHGYCCHDSDYALEVTAHTEPPGAPKWYRYVWIAAAIMLFLLGAAAYFFIRARARQARQDGYVAAVDLPGRGASSSSSGGGAGAGSTTSSLPGTGRVLGSSSSSAPSSSSASASGTTDGGAGEGRVHSAGSSGWARVPATDENATG